MSHLWDAFPLGICRRSYHPCFHKFGNQSSWTARNLGTHWCLQKQKQRVYKLPQNISCFSYTGELEKKIFISIFRIFHHEASICFFHGSMGFQIWQLQFMQSFSYMFRMCFKRNFRHTSKQEWGFGFSAVEIRSDDRYPLITIVWFCITRSVYPIKSWQKMVGGL